MEIPVVKSMDGTVTSGARISCWIDTTEPLFTEKLDKDLETDVVIVGGGIAGMTTAYAIAREGKRVVLVEDGFIGSGETGRTTAHLVTALDDRYYTLEKQFGKKKTKLIAESHRCAIDYVEMVVHQDGIDCDFVRVPGYLFLHPTDDVDSIRKELKAAKSAGLDVEELVDVPGMEIQGGPCIRFNNQAQFHPLKYLKGLAKGIQDAGGQIYTETHAKEIDSTGIVTADGYKVKASFVVIATNSPVNNKFMLHSRQFPYRTYVIGVRVKKGSVPAALWWDTGDFLTNAQIPPYHYVRTEPFDADYDLLIVGGEDHPTGLPEDDGHTEQKNRFAFLESWTRERFPVEDVVYQWSGQVIEPYDSLAYIGHNPMDKKNVFIATGDSGNGMTHGTIAGMLLSDLISGKDNKFKDIYKPSRIKLLKAGGIFAKELVGSLTEYLVTKKDDEVSKKIWEMQPGEGAVVQLRDKKYGVYMDAGKLAHIVSTDCTHLGCTIKWNADEKSWDCPCHGSRYTYKGKVVNGPANADLLYHKVNIEDIHKEKH